MNRHVNAIAGLLSLRPPQRRSLEILDSITEIALPNKGADVASRAGGHLRRVGDLLSARDMDLALRQRRGQI